MSLRERRKRALFGKKATSTRCVVFERVMVYLTEAYDAPVGKRCLQVAGGQCLPEWEVNCRGIYPKDLNAHSMGSVYWLDLKWREGTECYECELRDSDGLPHPLELYRISGAHLDFVGHLWDVTMDREDAEPVFSRVLSLYRSKTGDGVYDGIPVSTADVISALAYLYFLNGDHVPPHLREHDSFFKDINLGVLGIGWRRLLEWCGREFGVMYVCDFTSSASRVLSSAKEVARVETELGLLNDYLEHNLESFDVIVDACNFIGNEGGTFRAWRDKCLSEERADFMTTDTSGSGSAKESLRTGRAVLDAMEAGASLVDSEAGVFDFSALKLGVEKFEVTPCILADVAKAWDAVLCNSSMSKSDKGEALKALLGMAKSRMASLGETTYGGDTSSKWTVTDLAYTDDGSVYTDEGDKLFNTFDYPSMSDGWSIVKDKESGGGASCGVAEEQASVAEALGFNVLDLVNGVAVHKAKVRGKVPVYDVPDELVISKSSWSFVLNALDLGRYPMLLGPKGCGKSSVARAVAESRGWDFFEFDMGQVAKPKRFFLGGMIVGEGGLTQKVRSEFFTAFTSERPTLILLDEITRASGGAANFLMTVLARNQSFLYDEDLGRRFHRGRHVHIIGAGNNGYQYVSTGRLDSAFEDRFVKIVLDYLGRDDETALILRRCPEVSKGDAYQLAGVSEALRKAETAGTLTVSLSTRQVLDAAAFVGLGYSVKEVVDSVLLTNYVIAGELEEARGVLKSL